VSHPFMPQPYYLVRQSRLSAPWPAPMGAYTAGIFDDTYRNMPSYIREDRIAGFGNDGYYSYGFGADGACMPPEEAAAALAPLVREICVSLAAQVPDLDLPWPVGKISVKDSVAKKPASDYVGPLTTAIQKAAAVNADIHPLVEQAASIAVEAILGGSIRSALAGVGVFTKIADEAVKQLPGGNICTPFRGINKEQMGLTGSEGGALVQKMIDSLCDNPNNINRMAECARWKAILPLVQGGMSIYDATQQVGHPDLIPRTAAYAPTSADTAALIASTRTRSLVGQRSFSFTREQPSVAPQSSVAPPETAGGGVAPKAAGGTVALLGAAALALLLLRR